MFLSLVWVNYSFLFFLSAGLQCSNFNGLSSCLKISKPLNVDVVVVEGLDCCFLFPENIKHVVVCESRGLHEWITQTVL